MAEVIREDSPMTHEEERPGWICPKCKHVEVLIMATVLVMVTVEGCKGTDCSNYEWDDDSYARCHKCGWEGTANDCARAAQEEYPELAS